MTHPDLRKVFEDAYNNRILTFTLNGITFIEVWFSETKHYEYIRGTNRGSPMKFCESEVNTALLNNKFTWRTK